MTHRPRVAPPAHLTPARPPPRPGATRAPLTTRATITTRAPLSTRAPLAALAALAALGACEDRRTVTLLFGPNEQTLTAGFACRDDSGAYLFQRARAGATYDFQIVVDVIDLGPRFPGCRGEEVVAACAGPGGRCATIARTCTAVHIPAGSISPEPVLLKALHDQLGHPQLLAQAPRAPIVARVVATTQPCAELAPADGSFPRLAGALATGCAYSCPVVLDDFAGALGVALDTLDDRCAAQVAGCAGFAP